MADETGSVPSDGSVGSDGASGRGGDVSRRSAEGSHGGASASAGAGGVGSALRPSTSADASHTSHSGGGASSGSHSDAESTGARGVGSQRIPGVGGLGEPGTSTAASRAAGPATPSLGSAGVSPFAAGSGGAARFAPPAPPVTLAAARGDRANHYQLLLQQVTDLHTDLTRTVTLCQALKSENDNLKGAYATVKTDLLKMRAKYQDARRTMLEEAEARVSVEKKHEDLVAQWRQQLEAKAEEFDELQRTLSVPRDLDMLRMKIQEEMEVPHNAKVAELKAQCEEATKRFNNTWREHTLLKVEFEQFTADQAKEAESVYEAHKTTVAELKRQLAQAHEAAERPTSDDAVRALKRELDASKTRLKHLESELADLRQAKEDAVVAREEAALAHSREVTELVGRLRVGELDKDTFKRRAESASDELTRTTKALAEAKSRLDVATKDIERGAAALVSKDRELEDMAKEHGRALDDLRAEAGRERDATMRQLNEANARARALDEANGALEKAAKEAEAAHAEQMLAATEAARDKAAALEAEVAAKNEELAEISERHMAADDNRAETVARLQAKVESLREEMSHHSKEKASLEARLKEAKESASASIDELEELRATHEEEAEEYRTLQARHRELLAKEHALGVHKNRLEMTVQYLQNELVSVQDETDKARSAHVTAIKDSRTSRHREQEIVAAAQATLKKRLSESKAANEHALRKATKRADEYKRQLLELYKKYKAVQSAAGRLETEKEAIKQANEVELATTVKRLRELERERELYQRSNASASASRDSGGGATAASSVR